MRSCTCSTALIAISRGERWFPWFWELDDFRWFLELDDFPWLLELDDDRLFELDEDLRLEPRLLRVLDSAIV
jgi:hypothetical protein